MFGVVSLTGPSRAAAVVALVFVEAVGLYVGYGAATTAAMPAVRRVLGGD